MTWLTRTPQCVVGAHVDMLERLAAEESTTRATETAVGRSLKPGGWIQRQWSLWRKSTERGRHATKATPDQLQAAGIAVKVVSRG